MVLFPQKTRPSLLCIALSVLFSGAAVTAQAQVTLRSNDGSMEIAGKLVGITDTTFTLKSAVGEMQISRDSVSCEGEECPKQLKLEPMSFSGSSAMAATLLPNLMQSFVEDVHSNGGFAGSQGSSPNMQVMLHAEGSQSGFENLRDRSTEIAMSTRRINRDEAMALQEDGSGFMVRPEQERTIAVDPLVVVVSPDNPVDVLSMEQIAGIFSGTITNWQEVGGQDMPIAVVVPSSGSGARDVFAERVLNPARVQLAPRANALGGEKEVADHVAATPGSIGYAGLVFARNTKSIDLITECGMRTSASAFAAKSEEYPLQRRLYLYNREDTTSEMSQAFLDYVLTNGAQEVVAEAGFIDLAIIRGEKEDFRDRMQTAIEHAPDSFESRHLQRLKSEANLWLRMSVSFRFPRASSMLDGKAHRDLNRLVEYLAMHQGGARVAVVGFTDNAGPIEPNIAISEKLAADVLAQIRKYGGSQLSKVEFSSMGFGPLAPVACNSTQWGRAANRRVEIWIR